MTWQKFFTDPSMVALMVGALLALMVIWSWHKDDSQFDLRDLFMDTHTKRMSVEKTAAITALVVSSWGFVSQIQDGNMTEFYFVGYIGAWGLVRVGSSWVKSHSPENRRKTDADQPAA